MKKTRIEQFWRGYACMNGGEYNEVEFIFDGEKFIGRCSCFECGDGRLCQHIAQFLPFAPLNETIKKYPLKIERLKKNW